MENNLPTIIIRHRKENKKKCTLEPLRSLEGFDFYHYPKTKELPCLDSYVLLDFDGPPLSLEDRDKEIILIDGTWKYAEKMYKDLFLDAKVSKRSLPSSIVTAYPRKQDDCSNPDRGLASIEALYVAFCILNKDREALLDSYYFKGEFLAKNASFFGSIS